MNHWRELAPVTPNNRKEEEDVVKTGKKRPAASDGGGAVEGGGGCSVRALSLLLLLASVQSVTRIRSKLSGWMMRLPSAGPAHREQLPPLETCLAQ